MFSITHSLALSLLGKQKTVCCWCWTCCHQQNLEAQSESTNVEVLPLQSNLRGLYLITLVGRLQPGCQPSRTFIHIHLLCHTYFAMHLLQQTVYTSVWPCSLHGDQSASWPFQWTKHLALEAGTKCCKMSIFCLHQGPSRRLSSSEVTGVPKQAQWNLGENNCWVTEAASRASP